MSRAPPKHGRPGAEIRPRLLPPAPHPRAHAPAPDPAPSSPLRTLVSLRAAPAFGVVALAGVRTSYACLDDSTFYAILRGRSYPSGLPVELCDLFRVDAAGVAHVSGAPGRCPHPA